MSDLLHPTDLLPESAVFQDLDPVTQTFRPDLAPGAMQKNVPSAPTLQTVRLRYSRAGRSQLFRMQAFYKALRGRANSVWLWPFGRSIQGAFSAPELLTNNDFANGTTGWTANNGTLSASNRALRITRTSNGANPFITQQPTATQYTMLAARAFPLSATPLELVNSTTGIGVAANYGDGYGNGDPYANTIARRVRTAVAETAAGTLYLDNNVVGGIAGGYHEWSWVSLARCLLVDNGPNSLLRSDEFDNAAWSKVRCSASANFTTAPDGTTTADKITEDSSATTTHLVGQAFNVPSAAADFSFTVALNPSTRTWAQLTISEGTGSTEVSAYFNLSTGAVGTTAVGANWANVRTFVTNLGGGWFAFTVIGRKTNAATQVSGNIYMATGDGGRSYTGGGSAFFVAWRATLAQSSVPVRPAQTTSAATTGTSQTGSALYVRGGRTPSEGALAGALLKGDFVEIVTPTGSELNAAAANLDLDAAGGGYLQLVNPMRSSPADGAAVIVNQPMGKFTLTAEPAIPELVTGMGEFEATFAEDWL